MPRNSTSTGTGERGVKRGRREGGEKKERGGKRRGRESGRERGISGQRKYI